MNPATLDRSAHRSEDAFSRTAAVLRDRAADLRALAEGSHQLVAIAYRRRAAELELVASVADARQRASSPAA
jgi:hypothetical protein